MTVSESKSLLVEKLEENDYDEHDLIELVDVLEKFPPSLTQAAAFIGENPQTVGEYLHMHRRSDSSKTKLL